MARDCRTPVQEDDEIVTCFRDGTVTLRSNRRTDGFTNADKEIGYQGVRKGDLVIHAMDAFAGAIGVSDSDGKSTPVYSVCAPLRGKANAHYLSYALREMARRGYITSLGQGIRERSTDFRWSNASEVMMPVPPFEEQCRIAAFLDHETARIDELVHEQERLNELLDEKLQATIKHVVENGLPGTVGSWKRAPFKYVARIRNGRDYKEVEEADGPYPVIGSGGEFARASKYLYDGESVLLGRKGTIDKPLYVEGRFWTVDTMFYTEVVPGNAPKFVYYLSTAFPFDALSTRTALPSMTQEALGAVRVRLPSLAEQRRIVEFLDAEAERVNQIRALQTKNIALLRERRSALISAAVTGQLDLNDWCASERETVAEVA